MYGKCSKHSADVDMSSNIIFAILCFVIVSCEFKASSKKRKSLTELYVNARHAYLDNEWTKCADGFEEAIAAYRKYIKVNLECKQKCNKKEEGNRAGLISGVNNSELAFYEKKVVTTLCLLRCKFSHQDYLSNDEFITKEQLGLYESLEPYNFLQLCYHQLKLNDEALETAFTYYINHQDDPVAKSNLEYYLLSSGKDIGDIRNRQAFRHTKIFYEAKDSYESNNWHLAAAQFESALNAYWTELENCRLLCDKSFDHGWFPDFVSSVANHFTYCLKCRNQCKEKLSNLDGHKVGNFVSLVFHYLQYCYFKDKSFEKAAECVASYQLFDSINQDMINNKNYYMEELGVKPTFFVPREEAVVFKETSDSEAKILDFIEKEFVIDLLETRNVDDSRPPRIEL